jgi:hypothetical protein
MGMIHREELLQDRQFCRENTAPSKIELLAWSESLFHVLVEVRPELVRFKDGLTGRVRLRRKELTGVLAPLRDEQFFEQVFIDYGAVAWPGEIDLAPDAMYAQVTRSPAGEPDEQPAPHKATPGKSRR